MTCFSFSFWGGSLSTAHYSLLITHYSLLITHYLFSRPYISSIQRFPL
ncbi:MAG: hypothetical protein F6K47_17195 [Symploca sp. SIO2E6]|nr:hypothetical protein [Symploca sp. SIO2E6]